MPRKISKTEQIFRKKMALQDKFKKAHRICVHNNICIAADCVIDKAKWRIVVEKRNSNGDVLERICSDDPKDPKKKIYYTNIDELNIRIMEITCFYAESFESNP